MPSNIPFSVEVKLLSEDSKELAISSEGCSEIKGRTTSLSFSSVGSALSRMGAISSSSMGVSSREAVKQGNRAQLMYA